MLGRLLVHASLNDLKLLVAHAHAALQLLLQDRVLRHKAGRQASNTNFLDTQAVAARESKGCRGSAASGDTLVLGKV